jgi:hypothetical protein
MDELTEGVAIASPDDLFHWECAEFVQSRLHRDVLHGLCPWTKVGQIHTSAMPPLPGPCTADAREAIHKCMIDATWSMSFRYVMERMNLDTKNRVAFEFEPQTLASLNQRKADQLAKVATRSEVRVHEFSQQVRDKAMPIFTALLGRWHVEHGFPEGMAALLRDVDAVGRTAIDGFTKRTLGRLLPGLSIGTELYALYEVDGHTSKPLSTNDWFDSRHAVAALPYCDLFLTERGLAHRLKTELRADVQYRCQVIGSLDDANKELNVVA